MKKHILSFMLLALALAPSSSLTSWAGNSCPRLGERLSAKEYCERYAEIARQEMVTYGIPASVTLAQGMLESDWGSSYLAIAANNHFGIKAYRVSYTKKTVSCDDDKAQEPFCAFTTVEEGYHYHSLFLKDNTRYAKLFTLSPSDYSGWAYGLRECGYATDPEYGKKLVSIIERYNLNQYDEIIRVRQYYVTSNDKRQALKYIRLLPNDNLKTISKETGVSVSRLRRYNELRLSPELHENDIIYLQSKRSKAMEGYETHTVQPGETLWSIAQMYGVTTSSIKRRNRLRRGEIQVGMVLRLR